MEYSLVNVWLKNGRVIYILSSIIGAIVVLIIPSIVLIASLYVTIRKAYPLYRKQVCLSRTGIEITGVVVHTRRVYCGESYDVIDVEYEIAGHSYTYTFDGDERFIVGDEVTLIVDPDNPTNAVLKDGRWDRNYFIWGLILSGILFLILIIAITEIPNMRAW